MSLHDQSQPFVPSEFAPKPMMTLRDYFAAKAMQSILVSPDPKVRLGGNEAQAKWAYEMADAMLAERDK
jgi:hypothetical protein